MQHNANEGVTLVLVLIMRTHSFWQIFFPPLNWVTSSSDSACLIQWDRYNTYMYSSIEAHLSSANRLYSQMTIYITWLICPNMDTHNSLHNQYSICCNEQFMFSSYTTALSDILEHLVLIQSLHPLILSFWRALSGPLTLAWNHLHGYTLIY